MELTAGLGSVDDYIRYIEAGADECFCGYIPYAWDRKYGTVLSLNRREVRCCSVQLGAFSELEILAAMVRAYQKPVQDVYKRQGDDHAAKGSDQGVYQLRTPDPQNSYFPGRGRDCKAAVSELQYHDQNSGKISAVRPVQPKEPAGNLSGEHFTGIKGMQPGGIPVSYTHLDVYKRQV